MCVSSDIQLEKEGPFVRNNSDVSSRFSALGLIVIQHTKSLDGKFPCVCVGFKKCNRNLITEIGCLQDE